MIIWIVWNACDYEIFFFPNENDKRRHLRWFFLNIIRNGSLCSAQIIGLDFFLMCDGNKWQLIVFSFFSFFFHLHSVLTVFLMHYDVNDFGEVFFPFFFFKLFFYVVVRLNQNGNQFWWWWWYLTRLISWSFFLSFKSKATCNPNTLGRMLQITCHLFAYAFRKKLNKWWINK